MAPAAAASRSSSRFEGRAIHLESGLAGHGPDSGFRAPANDGPVRPQEALRLHFSANAEHFQNTEDVRRERFPDVRPREARLLQNDGRVAKLCQPQRDGRAGRSTTQHADSGADHGASAAK